MFNKVHESLNTAHHVKRAEWDLRVPTVLWAYRTVWKNLTARAPLKPKNEVNAIIPMEREKLSLCIVAPVDMMVCRAWKEAITQL